MKSIKASIICDGFAPLAAGPEGRLHIYASVEGALHALPLVKIAAGRTRARRLMIRGCRIRVSTRD